MGGYNKQTAQNFHKEALTHWKKNGFAQQKRILKLINFSLKNKTALDAGCGFGYDAEIIRQKGANVLGVDASPYLIKIAQKNYPDNTKNFSVANIENLPFKNNSFDLIVCKYVLHYLKEPDTALKEFFRCLKKDGVLIFSVHHPMSSFLLGKSKNYFKKEKIKINIYKNVNVTQFTHTITDYFSEYFLSHFKIESIEENCSSNPIFTKRKIPGFLLVKAIKKTK